jgi:peroxiredoxin
MTIAGFIIVLGVLISYLTMLFVLHRFTYKTWIFDVAAVVGTVKGIVSWFQAGGSWLSWSTIILGIIWFLVSRTELRIVGSKELHLREGDMVPPMTFLKTDSTVITEQDLIGDAPTLLALYRGWWCPSSKVQLDEIMASYETLNQKGVHIYAASVDEPELAAPIQEHVGNHITILCSTSEEVLKKIGIVDTKGAPWYDRLLFGAPERPIAMPSTLIINKEGRIIFVSRSTRVDDRPRANEILTSLSGLP